MNCPNLNSHVTVLHSITVNFFLIIIQPLQKLQRVTRVIRLLIRCLRHYKRVSVVSHVSQMSFAMMSNDIVKKKIYRYGLSFDPTYFKANSEVIYVLKHNLFLS